MIAKFKERFASLETFSHNRALVGEWVSPYGSYKIERNADGRLDYKESLSDGTLLHGVVQKQGEWHLAKVRFGSVRVKPGGVRNTVMSQFKSVAKRKWQDVVIARSRQVVSAARQSDVSQTHVQSTSKQKR